MAAMARRRSVAYHKPIMVHEAMELLAPERGGLFVDCTLGGGGHAEAVLTRLPPSGRLVGFDRDPDAIRASEARLGAYPNFTAVHGNFFELKSLLDGTLANGILCDLGVSSYQLDNVSRGFSYKTDAPLDMRMDTSAGITAKDLLNTSGEAEIARILREYGEEKWAKRIARFIVERRPVSTTGELADIVKAAIPAPARREGGHPAKRTFQAIRIAVNGELDELEQAVENMVDCLMPGGRLVIITFHSLEDRIVKQVFKRRENPCTCPTKAPQCVCGKAADAHMLSRKPIIPSETEKAENPRSTSAKLRALEKI